MTRAAHVGANNLTPFPPTESGKNDRWMKCAKTTDSTLASYCQCRSR